MKKFFTQQKVFIPLLTHVLTSWKSGKLKNLKIAFLYLNAQKGGKKLLEGLRNHDGTLFWCIDKARTFDIHVAFCLFYIIQIFFWVGSFVGKILILFIWWMHFTKTWIRIGGPAVQTNLRTGLWCLMTTKTVLKNGDNGEGHNMLFTEITKCRKFTRRAAYGPLWSKISSIRSLHSFLKLSIRTAECVIVYLRKICQINGF